MEQLILEQLWKRALSPEPTDDNLWNQEIETLYRLGISMEEAIRYLYFEKPDLNTFQEWVKTRTNIDTDAEDVTTADVLTAEDLQFWEENGYVIVKNAISDSDCEATQQAIWEFLGMHPEQEASWYKSHDEQRGLMLTFSDHPTLNKNRLSPRIKKAYEQLYKTDRIYKTIDKVSFNPPETAHYTFLGSPLHWDVSLKLPIPFGLQGLLYLTDCGPEDGAFHCVPGFHNRIENWIHAQQPSSNLRETALKTLQPVPITGKTGDFIIWHQALPHCASPNHGKAPRMVQYLTYFPEDYQTAAEWL